MLPDIHAELEIKGSCQIIIFYFNLCSEEGGGVVPFNVFPFLTIFGLNMFFVKVREWHMCDWYVKFDYL